MKSLVNDFDDAADDDDDDDDDADQDDDDELLMLTYTFQTNLCVLPESGFLIDMMVIII